MRVEINQSVCVYIYIYAHNEEILKKQKQFLRKLRKYIDLKKGQKREKKQKILIFKRGIKLKILQITKLYY